MMNKFKHLLSIRHSYESSKLKKKNLPNNPLDLFAKWLNEAYTMKLFEPNAMCIATVDEKNKPYQRMVLLKYFDNKNMIFFTNINSRKAIHLKNNNNISVLFNWIELERQVMILGNVRKLPSYRVKKYFDSRPRDSQISAWASNQSKRINSRIVLERHFHKMKEKFKKYKKIPLPKFWGGYNIKINVIEFWQGRKNRLHDRFIFFNKINAWKVYRLSP